MSRKYHRYEPSEGPITGFLMGQLAAIFFSLPTAAFLWLATNKYLAVWGASGAFIGSKGFWLILGCFAFISVFMPRLFPSLMGKIWHGIISLERLF